MYKLINSLAAFGICMGAMFKIQHYPMASILLIGGLVLQIVGYFVSPAKNKTMNPFTAVRHPNLGLQIAHSFSVAFIILGALFKVQHYPGASIFMIIGWSSLAVTLIVKVYVPPKEPEDIDISNFGKGIDDE